MSGFRELEGREIGSPPMSSEWPTACSRNTGMFCRMKRPKPSREAVCRCSGPRFRSERFSPFNPKDQPSQMLNGKMGCRLLARLGQFLARPSIALRGNSRQTPSRGQPAGSTQSDHQRSGSKLAWRVRVAGATSLSPQDLQTFFGDLVYACCNPTASRARLASSSRLRHICSSAKARPNPLSTSSSGRDRVTPSARRARIAA
jgi:hypothetical protein